MLSADQPENVHTERVLTTLGCLLLPCLPQGPSRRGLFLLTSYAPTTIPSAPGVRACYGQQLADGSLPRGSPSSLLCPSKASQVDRTQPLSLTQLGTETHLQLLHSLLLRPIHRPCPWGAPSQGEGTRNPWGLPGWRAAWWSVKMPSKARDGITFRPEGLASPKCLHCPKPWIVTHQERVGPGEASGPHQLGSMLYRRRHMHSNLQSWAPGIEGPTHHAACTREGMPRGGQSQVPSYRSTP